MTARFYSRQAALLLAGIMAAQWSSALAQDRISSREVILDVSRSEKTPTGDPFVYAVGDRMKITFFEQLRSPGAGHGLLSDLVERSELGGEYQVQQDGQVFLPLLGQVHVAGLSPGQVQEDLALAFTRQIEGQVKVAVQLLEREPIYVTGPVTRPGTFKYVPGMTVLHALTLAGGLEGANYELWKLVDLGRERERLRKSGERLKTLLGKVAVLRAERDGEAAKPSSQLVQLMGRIAAQEAVAIEERLRILERRRTKDQKTSIEQVIAVTTNEMKILQEQMAQVEKRVMEKSERARLVNASRSRGSITDTTFYLAQSEVSDARERWHGARASIVQTERKLAELQQEKMRVTIDVEIAREQEMKQSMQSISEEEVTTAVLGNLLSSIPENYAKKRTDEQLSFMIVRRNPSSPSRLAVGVDGVLHPGDLIEVVLSGQVIGAQPSGATAASALRM